MYFYITSLVFLLPFPNSYPSLPQWIYYLLSPFSIGSMDMCPGLTSQKWNTHAEAPIWRTLILFQQPLTSCSFSFHLFSIYSTRLDLVGILQSLSACQLMVSLCKSYSGNLLVELCAEVLSRLEAQGILNLWLSQCFWSLSGISPEVLLSLVTC